MAYQARPRCHGSSSASSSTALDAQSARKRASILPPQHSRVLDDLTNESPVSGLSFPSATLNQARFSPQVTPGQGEEALRSQVTILLQKSGNEAYRTPSLRALSHINGFLLPPSSTTPLVAAAPPSGNPSTDHISKPEISSISNRWSQSSTVDVSVCMQETGSACSLITSIKPTPVEDVIDAEEAFRGPLGNLITRALHFDSPNIESDISSGIVFDSSDDLSDCPVLDDTSPPGQDNHAVSNLQRGYSSGTEYEIEEEDEEPDEDHGFGEVDHGDGLSAGFRQHHQILTKSKGKHVRFSDDEIEGKPKQDVRGNGRMKGTPVGKFLHFFEDAED